MEKRENAGYQHFLLFPDSFQFNSAHTANMLLPHVTCFIFMYLCQYTCYFLNDDFNLTAYKMLGKTEEMLVIMMFSFFYSVLSRRIFQYGLDCVVIEHLFERTYFTDFVFLFQQCAYSTTSYTLFVSLFHLEVN